MTTILLNIPYIRNGMKMKIHPVLVRSKALCVLVDCGHPGDAPKIEEALSLHGLGLKDLTHLVITHHDHDHMGAAAEIKTAFPHIQVVALKEETPYIEGVKKSLRLEQAEAIYPFLPEHEKEKGRKFQAYLESIAPVTVDIQVSHESYLDASRAIQFLNTPGHMPGHLSVYLPQIACLISGDALMVHRGQLIIPNPKYAVDHVLALKTLDHLRHLDIEESLCYHGGAYKGDFGEAIKTLLNKGQ